MCRCAWCHKAARLSLGPCRTGNSATYEAKRGRLNFGPKVGVRSRALPQCPALLCAPLISGRSHRQGRPGRARSRRSGIHMYVFNTPPRGPALRPPPPRPPPAIGLASKCKTALQRRRLGRAVVAVCLHLGWLERWPRPSGPGSAAAAEAEAAARALPARAAMEMTALAAAPPFVTGRRRADSGAPRRRSCAREGLVIVADSAAAAAAAATASVAAAAAAAARLKTWVTWSGSRDGVTPSPSRDPDRYTA